MADDLHTDARARCAASEYSRRFDQPGCSFCLRLVKRHEALRCRRESGRLRVQGAVHARMTVLRDGGSLGFATVRGLHSTMDGGVAGQ
ncbi:MAG TPA: hypothetical protein PLA97_22085 [Rubrivivax sp.]|nr:hypothetical protein [Rubrivivax sp.]